MNLIEKLVITAVVALVAVVLVGGAESPSERQALYSAWMKANHNTELTYDEWVLLRNEGLLPGQQVPANNAATGVAIGTAIGAGMASGARR
jgi:hypothetical protein